MYTICASSREGLVKHAQHEPRHGEATRRHRSLHPRDRRIVYLRGADHLGEAAPKISDSNGGFRPLGRSVNP